MVSGADMPQLVHVPPFIPVVEGVETAQAALRVPGMVQADHGDAVQAGAGGEGHPQTMAVQGFSRNQEGGLAAQRERKAHQGGCTKRYGPQSAQQGRGGALHGGHRAKIRRTQGQVVPLPIPCIAASRRA